jgi:hypothetical protein
MLNYRKQKKEDLMSLIDINNSKIEILQNSPNKLPFIIGLINKLKKQNLELIKIINNK